MVNNNFERIYESADTKLVNTKFLPIYYLLL